MRAGDAMILRASYFRGEKKTNSGVPPLRFAPVGMTDSIYGFEEGERRVSCRMGPLRAGRSLRDG